MLFKIKTSDIPVLLIPNLYCIFDTTISNEKGFNCKVVDLIEYYNFDADFISI